MPFHFLITVDVEDWFQVENFKRRISFDSWPVRELRVEKNTHRLLDLFDSQKLETSKDPTNPSNSTDTIRATFFFLGWLAERIPNLVREVYTRGHEVASHGHNHELPTRMNPADLKKDLADSKKRLENIIGAQVPGYRAPSFAVSGDILKIIEDCGYLYDSSYNSFGLHGRYGQVDLSGCEKTGLAVKLSENFYELPISNLEFFSPSTRRRAVLPWGGGGYFRLIPFFLFKTGVQSILKRDGAYSFYLHPWEIDPDQPRVKKASLAYQIRHYINIAESELKLARMIQSFSQCSYLTCTEYLNTITNFKNTNSRQQIPQIQ